MTDLERRVRELEDRDEIRELTARYCHCVAAADAAGIVDLFCGDGSFTMGPRSVKGRAELERFYTAIAGQPPLPFIQNHVIDDLRGDEARGRCSVEIRMVQNGEPITAAGWYDDHYRRDGARWRFAARSFHVFHMVPLRKGWA